MVNDLTKIKEYLKDKNICLLGNARSILNTKKDIEKFDVICRMNRAFSKGKEEYIGKRTDILFISTTLPEQRLINEMNPKFIVWMTPSDKRACDYIKNNAIQNPIEDWHYLNNFLTLNPSTGIMSIYFLLNHIEFKSLTVYGFDFWKTFCHYHNLKKQTWHNFKEEQIFIEQWIRDFKGKVKLL